MPAGLGVRAMYRVSRWRLAVGAAGGRSLWGWKAAAVGRWNPLPASDRLYVQTSFGFTGGARDVELQVPQEGGGTATGRFDFTPGRTVDVGLGYRWPGDGTYFEVYGGYSFNLRGTALQSTRIVLDETVRAALRIMEPGGIAWGMSYGWML